jgi:lipid-A-disaccharide synthase-like uncharacterized protein
MEDLRAVLYPLGLLSSIAFGARFILQWIQSEKKQASVVSRTFWQFSLLGNIFLALHAFIQFQYHVSLIQSLNAVISIRNLSLMKAAEKKAIFIISSEESIERKAADVKDRDEGIASAIFEERSLADALCSRSIPDEIVKVAEKKGQEPNLSRIVFILCTTATAVTLGFVLQDYFLFDSSWNWFRTPSNKWQAAGASLPFVWHVVGFASYALFSSRFWVQWIEAEKNQRSDLSLSFWWISFIGAILSLIYFFSINDPINAMGPGIGLIPYTRNLMLIYKSRRKTIVTDS